MTAPPEITCPGCGLRMPPSERATYDGYYNTSPECWSVYTEVLGAEFGNAIVYGQVHQITVDTYAVQHAGGRHPDKSIAIHLAGLHLVIERGLAPPKVPPLLQRLAETVAAWPHFEPPYRTGARTVCDVALVGSPKGHVETVEAWAQEVWAAWSGAHAGVSQLVDEHLTLAGT